MTKNKIEKVDLNKALSKDEYSQIEKDVMEILSETNNVMNLAYQNLVKKMDEYQKKKKSDLNSTLWVHRLIMKHLVLYPVRSLRIQTNQNNQSKENAYVYNVAIVKDIIDDELIVSGAMDKLNEVISKTVDKKLSKEDMKLVDYVG